MAFGQPAGPPAGPRQIQQLSELLQRAGYATFREARHPYGLNQRQAGGRFTGPEADELIERLEAAEAVRSVDVPGLDALAHPTIEASDVPAQRAGRVRRKGEVLSAFEDDLLVEELERRGWCCIPPITGVDSG